MKISNLVPNKDFSWSLGNSRDSPGFLLLTKLRTLVRIYQPQIFLHLLFIILETAVGHKTAVQDIGVHGEIQKVMVTGGFAQEYLPLFGRRSIPPGGVARPFHTRSMRSPRALPDRWLSTQTGEGILARTLRGDETFFCFARCAKSLRGLCVPTAVSRLKMM